MSDLVTIYALVDPRDNTIRYIGQSVNPTGRYPSFASFSGSNPGVQSWFYELKQEGLKPVIQTIETVSPGDADSREIYHIQDAVSRGVLLLNRAGNPAFNEDDYPIKGKIALKIAISAELYEELKVIAQNEYRSVPRQISHWLTLIVEQRKLRGQD